MRHSWPEDTEFTRKVLITEDRACPQCGRHMTICDHRRHPVHTLDGPLELICKLVHCPDRSCPAHSRTTSPLEELAIAPPGWLIAWDVFAFIGHRRCARHWSVPDIRNELLDTYKIRLSDDAISVYIDRYQTMLAARHQDRQRLLDDYRDVKDLVLSIDGLQPEKGHETLYVVRELRLKRVWFAVALLSSSEAEVQAILATAKEWVDFLGKPVSLWISDKQAAFLKGIAGEFDGVPHRYCANHFLRGLAKPILEADSSAKVQMRKKVRGVREIERQVLDDRRQTQVLCSQPLAEGEAVPLSEANSEASAALEATTAASPAGVEGASTETSEQTENTPEQPEQEAAEKSDEAGEVVLAYCAAVRGILNDDQGGPEHPPGLRMTEGLQEVRESLQRNLKVEAKKGGEPIINYSDWQTTLIEGSSR